MVLFNVFTGLKRRRPVADLPRKKRASLSSNVASRMEAQYAMEDHVVYMSAAQSGLTTVSVLLHSGAIDIEETEQIIALILMGCCLFASCAVEMIKLDSALLDLPENANDEAGYRPELKELALDFYENDDQCREFTRFTKQQIRTILDDFDLGYHYYVYYYTAHKWKYYKFRTETLFIYVLRKMSTASTHKQLADTEFGGDSGRWGRGFNHLIKYLDKRYMHLVGPRGLTAWVHRFPYFSEVIREYITRDKDRVVNGVPTVRNMPNNVIEEGQFNIIGFTDCTVYEICRPGSGPATKETAAPRRQGWYHKQRAFYDGYHGGMEACCKILSIVLPNGISVIYGPTSGREDDRTLFRLSELDDYMLDLCQQHHNGDLYCVYGDGIFAGYWYCLRSRHIAPPNLPLTLAQIEENDNMCSARESVEWSYAKAESLWPLLNRKDQKKVDNQGGERVFAEIRVAWLLTNLSICAAEGSNMTGDRGFRCPPPSLEDYLSMRLTNNI